MRRWPMVSVVELREVRLDRWRAERVHDGNRAAATSQPGPEQRALVVGALKLCRLVAADAEGLLTVGSRRGSESERVPDQVSHRGGADMAGGGGRGVGGSRSEQD